jgi:hypothetical protein
MIDSKGGAFGFDCCLASRKFRVFQQPARFMSPWEALAMLTAAFLYPLALRPLGELGVHPILVLGGCFAFIGAAFLTARVIVKRRSSLK